MGGWGCPHEDKGKCSKIQNIPCDPGMKGCVLAGRFVFSQEEKNRPGGPKRRNPRKATGHRDKEK